MFETELYVPKNELDSRLTRVQREMAGENLDGLLILQAAGLLYFSGTTQACQLYLPASGRPLLMVRKSFARAREESALEEVVPFRSPKEITGLIRDHGYPAPARLGLELDVLPANLYLKTVETFAPARILDASPLIRRVRALKSKWEISMMRVASRQVDAMVRAAAQALVEGMAEIELAAIVEGEARRQGHQGLIRTRGFNQDVFYGHILGGPSAAVPSFFDSPTGGTGLSPAMPHGPGWNRIRRGDPVMIDICGAHNGYVVDQSRVLSIGRLPDPLRGAQDLALRVQEAVISAAVPGATFEDLWLKAEEVARAAGLSEHFMGYGADRATFVGHNIGLELDEAPVLARGFTQKLRPGMTFALEPKFNFPGRGVVGIENTWLVTPEGCERLTTTPDDLIEK